MVRIIKLIPLDQLKREPRDEVLREGVWYERCLMALLPISDEQARQQVEMFQKAAEPGVIYYYGRE